MQFESCWLRNLFVELHCPIQKSTLIYCDNVGAIYLFGNHAQHQRTKHIEMNIHFVQKKVARRQVRVLHVPLCQQTSDIFTKGLPSVLFGYLWDSLSDRQPPTSTAGLVRIDVKIVLTFVSGKNIISFRQVYNYLPKLQLNHSPLLIM